MVHNRAKGLAIKKGLYSELLVAKDAKYFDVVLAGMQACNIASKSDNSHGVCLFKPSVIRIAPSLPNGREWTLSHYLKVTKKAPIEVRLGVGYEENDPQPAVAARHSHTAQYKVVLKCFIFVDFSNYKEYSIFSM